MVYSSVKPGLTETVGGPVILEACAAATSAAAVPLTSIAGLADREGPPAPAAQQQVQQDLRRQALDHGLILEEWTTSLGGAMLSA